MKRILIIFGQILSYILPPRFWSIYKTLHTLIYTGLCRRSFATFGRGSIIAFRAVMIKGGKHISIGNNCRIGKNCRLTAWEQHGEQVFSPEIKIGNNCSIGTDAHITAIKRILIGDNLLTGSNVYISDNSHGEFGDFTTPPLLRNLTSKGDVIIGNNVWIGNNVCILSGVTIGDGAIIAANSVVTKSIPANSLAAGVPAQIKKQQIKL